ncbi:MAG: hypothetical protein BWX56_01340 [Euryarchaeota archaeon ADurb.Bin023]|jgi:hypothetical protein|nr:MAG: hypothetical protein BWX56_01340 [Euryarchaeota archaeon ADurb.Bin023]HNV04905.1 SprT family zinc-dependent metalloprotease [Petrotogaceae bacterium]HPG47756.1 SprT family zinc-dependent metalloprotease [Petrotogaceae bacterium]HPO26685.1 SprT family zinc-dependent metalloprotease [Petrotogaceae bacterium]
MPFVIVENEVIDYFLVKKDKKNIGIIIKPDGTVVVTAPRYLSEKQINDVVQKKAVIIRNRLYQIKENLEKSVKKKIEDGESILFMGKTYRIRIKEDEFIPSLRINLIEDFMDIFLNPNIPLELKSSLKREKTIDWYKQQAKNILTERTSSYARLMKLSFSSIRIKEQNSRWASCSNIGNLNYNWKIIMAPVPVIDYIIVHELSHLVEMNHSSNFWNIVSSVLPDYKERKDWLKTFGPVLEI